DRLGACLVGLARVLVADLALVEVFLDEGHELGVGDLLAVQLRDDRVVAPRARGGGALARVAGAARQAGDEQRREGRAPEDRGMSHGRGSFALGWRSLALSAPCCPDKIRVMRRPVCVALAGGSGAGKSALAAILVEAVGPERVLRIAQDAYYRDLAGLPFD